jgi:hypothetical protein
MRRHVLFSFVEKASEFFRNGAVLLDESIQLEVGFGPVSNYAK